MFSALYIYIYVYIRISVYAYMKIKMYIYIDTLIHIQVYNTHKGMHIYQLAVLCLAADIYIYIYIYIYICICTHTYLFILGQRAASRAGDSCAKVCPKMGRVGRAWRAWRAHCMVYLCMCGGGSVYGLCYVCIGILGEMMNACCTVPRSYVPCINILSDVLICSIFEKMVQRVSFFSYMTVCVSVALFWETIK